MLRNHLQLVLKVKLMKLFPQCTFTFAFCGEGAKGSWEAGAPPITCTVAGMYFHSDGIYEKFF